MPRLRKLGKSGNYFAIFYDGTHSPKEKSYPLKTTRKDVAMKRYTEAVQGFERGTFDPWNPDSASETLSVAEAADRFLQAKEHLRPKSQRAYRIAVEGMQRCLSAGLLLRDVALKHIRPYLTEEGKARSTHRHRYRHLRTFLNWCVDQGHLDGSPLEDFTPPKERKKQAAFLSEGDLERLLNAIEHDAQAKRDGLDPETGEAKKHSSLAQGRLTWLSDVVRVAVTTGMRRGELAALRWGHVDLEHGYIHIRNTHGFVTKSGDERTIPLVADARDVIQRLRNEWPEAQPDDHVLRSGTGGPISADYTSRLFKRYVRIAGLSEELKFHSLRHTCASWLAMKGVPLQMIQQILGHSDIGVTQRYSHLLPDSVKQAVHEALSR